MGVCSRKRLAGDLPTSMKTSNIPSEERSAKSSLHPGKKSFAGSSRRRYKNVFGVFAGALPTVLALGGGAFTRPENIELLRENGITVWIDVDFEVARKRVQACERRPLARDPERFERLYHERRAFYSQAEYHIPVHTNDSKVALAAILKLNLLD